ncbi:MAG: glucose-1-phosphate thymidylyltransferase RfbA [Heliobacteriaceae bacterium]|nr:glucose-1-phosphate thymidylyltransferase RfbA [Heliobacteriaceae bacterium]MDD4587587.1 glucose-1-phosphate thymidylyltransferase RfbA [Heliobacteriaceae bacterium]
MTYKGIILAGGRGTRLDPLTRVINKHLLPVYDKPMIYYPLTTLLLAGVTEILVITNPGDEQPYQALLKDGRQWGITISYRVQTRPAGIAEALLIGRDFLGRDNCVLILGDNIFYGHNLEVTLQQAATQNPGATVFGYRVEQPELFGIAECDQAGRVVNIIEKPARPRSNLAVTGLYFYDHQAVSLALSLQPSARQELEISDLNRLYLQQGRLRLVELGAGFAWLDAGSPESLLQAAQFVATMEQRLGEKIACPETTALACGLITPHHCGGN